MPVAIALLIMDSAANICEENCSADGAVRLYLKKLQLYTNMKENNNEN